MASRPDLEALKSRLLAIGGRGFQLDWFLEAELHHAEVALLLAAGGLDSTDALTVRPMDLAECHRNVRRLRAQDRTIGWRFGMALSSDDVWRVHSWAIEGGRIVETTLPRLHYFGIDMGRLTDLRRRPPKGGSASDEDPYVRAARRLGRRNTRIATRLTEGLRRLRRPAPPRA